MKACPFCAEQIQDEAVKCRHCGELLDTDAARWRIYRKKLDAMPPDERAAAVARLTPSQQEFVRSGGATTRPVIAATQPTPAAPATSRAPHTQKSDVSTLRQLKPAWIAIGGLLGLAVLLQVLGLEPDRRVAPQVKQVEHPRANLPSTPSSSSSLDAPVTTKEFTFAVQGGEEITATAHPGAGGMSEVAFSPFIERTDGNLYNAALQSLWNIHGRNRGLFQLEQARLRPELGLAGGQALCWPLINPAAEFCVFPTKDEASGRLAAMTVWVK